MSGKRATPDLQNDALTQAVDGHGLQVRAGGVVFSNPAIDTAVDDAAITFDGLDLQSDDGWIDVRDYVRLTATAKAVGEDQTVTIEYRTHDDDEGGDLVPATNVVAGTRTELLTAENIEHVAAIRPAGKYTSADGGTLTFGGVLK